MGFKSPPCLQDLKVDGGDEVWDNTEIRRRDSRSEMIAQVVVSLDTKSSG